MTLRELEYTTLVLWLKIVRNLCHSVMLATMHASHANAKLDSECRFERDQGLVDLLKVEKLYHQLNAVSPHLKGL